MENIASDKNENTEAEVNPKLEPETTSKVDIQTKTEEANIKKKNVSKEQVINIEKDIINEQATSREELTTIVKDEVVKESEKPEVKTDVNKNNLKAKSEEKIKTNTQTTGNNSAVDDIIAAMQESQSISNNAQDTTQKVDPRLEKDIKQQLVEQGDVSIEN